MHAMRCRAPLWACAIFFAAECVAAEPVELPELVVRAPTESAIAPTTFHTVVDPDQETSSITTIPDLLSRVPGTTLRQLGSLGHLSTISIRGSSAEQVTVLLDGARLNTGGVGSVDLSSIPVASIERIEIIRGGGTTLFGSDAVGGVVNIITKEASGRVLEAEIGGGSFLTNTARTAYARQWQNKQFVASHHHLHSVGDYTFAQAATNLAGTTIAGGGTFTREHNQSLGESLLVKYRVHSDADTTIAITNDFYFGDRALPGLEIETTQLAPANPLEATQRLYRNSTQCAVDFANVWASALGMGFGLHNTFESSRFQDASPALGPAIDRLTLNDAVNPYLHFDYFAPTHTGGHDLVLRYDYRRDLFDDSAKNATTVSGGQFGRSTHSVALRDEWTIWNERLRILPAIRYTQVSQFGDNADYRLGVIGRPTRVLALKGNIETSQRAPSFLELFHPDEGFLRGNPNLNKERGWHWDAGAILELARFSAEAAYFQQRLSNSILFVPISATTIAPVNTFAVYADGIETSLEATPLDWCRLSGNYTWLRAHFESSQRQLPGRPKHTANGRIEVFGPLTRRWEGKLFAEAQWMSALPVTIENTVFLAARTTIDVGVGTTWKQRAGQAYFARAEMKNLTNVQIYDARGFPLPRRAFFITVGGRWG